MSWLSKLTSGLKKSSDAISESIGDVILRKKLDDEALETLEDALIMADVGAGASAEIVAAFAKGRFEKEISEEEIKTALAEQVAQRIADYALPLSIENERSANIPHVCLVVGVNGNGKTTSIGKMAHYYQQQGKKVMIAAADTFRAAAVEQLEVWAKRSGCGFVKGEANADPASVAYKALEQARAQGADIVFIDTAGRLHNQKNLMEELQKIRRVLQKVDDTAPHSVIQVLDATTGQNALTQVQAFKEVAGVSGLVVTKLDGTAKAGVVVALIDQFKLPVHAIGVGEGIEDLQPFDAGEYAKGLVGF